MIEPDLTGRVVLVTGSAAGLGRAIALRCAARGAAVVIQYRRSEAEADATAAEARECGAAGAMAVQCDVTDPDSVDAMFERIETELGGVDVLVNNVGDFAPDHWADLSLEDWHRVIDTNLIGTYLCSKRALPGMREESWGRIVNIGYAGAEKALAYPKNFPYFVAKTGVIMFTRMLAYDTMHDGITVNAVSPYVVETSDEFPAEAPRGRWASVEDVTQAVCFFLDEDSAYLSGENVEIDGGWLPERL